MVCSLFWIATGLMAGAQTNTTSQSTPQTELKLKQQQKKEALQQQIKTAPYMGTFITREDLIQQKRAEAAAQEAAKQEALLEKRIAIHGKDQLRWQRNEAFRKQAEKARADLILAQKKPPVHVTQATEQATRTQASAASMSALFDATKAPTDAYPYINPVFRNPANPYRAYMNEFQYTRHYDLYLKYRLGSGPPPLNF